MFRSYYGLSFNPFDKQMAREKDRFLSRDISEMLSRLDYLKDTRGIGLFTARPGMGKSFGLRCFAKGLNPNLYHMEYLCLSTVSVMEFYRQLCSVLGVEPRGGKPGMFRAVQEQILYLYRDKKQPLLLAVDEAQYLSTGILEDIKMLMNYGYDSLNYFTLILCWEPHLNSTLKSPSMNPCASALPCTTTFPGSQTRKWQGTSSTRSPVPETLPPSSTRRRFSPSTATPRDPPPGRQSDDWCADTEGTDGQESDRYQCHPSTSNIKFLNSRCL